MSDWSKEVKKLGQLERKKKKAEKQLAKADKEMTKLEKSLSKTEQKHQETLKNINFLSSTTVATMIPSCRGNPVFEGRNELLFPVICRQVKKRRSLIMKIIVFIL